jgi:SulP family sulfate permease
MHDIDDYPDATMTPGLLVYRYDAPLYFANARDFRKRALAAADAHAAGLHWFVLNVEANVDIDITAMDALEEVRAKLIDRGVVFAFARVKHDILGPLQTYGLADRVGADRLFPTLPTAEAATAPGRASRPAARTAPRPQTPSRTRGLTHRPTTEIAQGPSPPDRVPLIDGHPDRVA